MIPPLHWLLLFAAGIGAGFLNVLAGGGSTLVLPLLIFMGMDAAAANGTNRISILIQNITAVGTFRHTRSLWMKESLMLSLWTLPGAIAGAVLAVRVSDELFERILAVVLIGIIVTMLVKPARKDKERAEDRGKRWLIYPAMLAIGFYGGFIQVGVGFLFMAALYHILTLDLVRVNMHKVLIVLVYTVPAFGVFLFTGHVAWLPGLIVGAGSALGGWWAARLSLKGGEQPVKILLGVALFIMALKLFGLF